MKRLKQSVSARCSDPVCKKFFGSRSHEGSRIKDAQDLASIFTTFARRFFVQVIVCAVFEVVCAVFEVLTMAGFRRGIGTRAKTKLDVGTLQMQLD